MQDSEGCRDEVLDHGAAEVRCRALETAELGCTTLEAIEMQRRTRSRSGGQKNRQIEILVACISYDHWPKLKPHRQSRFFCLLVPCCPH